MKQWQSNSTVFYEHLDASKLTLFLLSGKNMGIAVGRYQYHYIDLRQAPEKLKKILEKIHALGLMLELVHVPSQKVSENREIAEHYIARIRAGRKYDAIRVAVGLNYVKLIIATVKDYEEVEITKGSFRIVEVHTRTSSLAKFGALKYRINLQYILDNEKHLYIEIIASKVELRYIPEIDKLEIVPEAEK